jgi:hypothetical protein
MRSPSATAHHRIPRPLSGAITALALAIVAGGPVAGAHVDRSPGPTAEAETVHGWPGGNPAPAGLYAWNVKDTYKNWRRLNWMHKVPETGGSVELTFFAGTPPDRPTIESHAVWRPYVMEDGPFDHPTRMDNDVRTEIWLLDVEGMRVAILLDSFSETDPALLAEARAVVDSIVVEPSTEDAPPRLVFRLEEGWDAG